MAFLMFTGAYQPIAVRPLVILSLAAIVVLIGIAAYVITLLLIGVRRMRRHLDSASRPSAPEPAPPAAVAPPAEEHETHACPAAEDRLAEAPDPDQGSMVTGRRKFLTALSLSAGAFGAAVVGLPFISFLLSPIRRNEPEIWRPVGSVDDFVPGATVSVSFRDVEQLNWAGFSAETAAWLRREADGSFIAFSSYCTHVGCPVRWQEDAQLFMCPCHGGAFYRNGAVAAGPPPRPLDLYDVRIRNNVVEIQTQRIPLPQ